MCQEKKSQPAAAKMEAIVSQWRQVRPDIDPIPMAVCGEIWRAGEILRQGVLANLSACGLDMAGFDVILTLRRQGQGASLSPSTLSKEMMLSTSAMTNRLDRLEKRGLIQRTQDPNDRRGLKILLTDEGFALANEWVESHVATEQAMLCALTAAEADQLRSLLNKISPAANIKKNNRQ